MKGLTRIQGFLPYVMMLFLNAFVDLGHKIVIQNTVFKIYDGQTQIVLTACVNALILIPFVLLFSPSGYLSDRYAKHQVMRISAWAALMITVLITLCYYQGWFWPAFSMTLLLAIQSAFYSPAKYGYIKELVGNDELARGNGIVQATTTTAILGGIFAFTILFELALADQPWQNAGDILSLLPHLGWMLVGCASIELLLAYRLPNRAQLDPQMRFNWRHYRSGRMLRDNLRVIHRNKIIWLTILGLTGFWAISQVLIAAFPAHAKSALGVSNTIVIQGLLAASGIGIMVGSVIAGRISRGHIETGIIPIGAIGIALCLLCSTLFTSVVLHGVNFFMLGIVGGLFIIPLNALMQFHADEQQLGRVLAGNNFIQNIGMLSFLLLTALFALWGINSMGLIYLLCAVAVAMALFTLLALPQSLCRYLVAWGVARRYRFDVLGFNQLPESGAVLLLGNHISWIDWALVQTACPRPIRFVMERGLYERWYLNWFLRMFDVIPIAAGRSREAFQQVARALDNGEVVCIFAEGTISRNGQLNEFRPGYVKALGHCEAAEQVVIVPFYLRGLWGSRFSRSSSKLTQNRRRGLKRNIAVAFGAPLPASTAPAEVRLKVHALGQQSWQQGVACQQPLPVLWLETALNLRSEMALADGRGNTLSYSQLVWACWRLKRQLHRRCAQQPLVMQTPATLEQAVILFAALLNGRSVHLFDESDSATSPLTDLRGLHWQAPRVAGLWVHLLSWIPVPLWRYWLSKRGQSGQLIVRRNGQQHTLSAAVLVAQMRQLADMLNLDDDDLLVSHQPLSTSYGVVASLLLPLLEGIPVILHPPAVAASAFAKSIARFEGTLALLSAEMVNQLNEQQRVLPLMLSSLRAGICLEPNGEIYKAAFEQRFHRALFIGLGCEPHASVISLNLPDKLDTSYWQLQLGQQIGSVGMPLPGVQVEIRDAQLQPVALGEPGELWFCAGLDADTAHWQASGYHARMQADGFIYLVSATNSTDGQET